MAPSGGREPQAVLWRNTSEAARPGTGEDGTTSGPDSCRASRGQARGVQEVEVGDERKSRGALSDGRGWSAQGSLSPPGTRGGSVEAVSEAAFAEPATTEDVFRLERLECSMLSWRRKA
jgi:hypothetical protein